MRGPPMSSVFPFPTLFPSVRIALRLEAVVGLVLDGISSRLLAHSRFESAPLDHEAVDDAVKHGLGVETRVDVLEQILDRLWGAAGLELDRNGTDVGLKFHQRGRLFDSCEH